jgi:hypothetical protein
VQVDKIVGSRAVYVGKSDPARIELVGFVEPRRAVHDNLGAEPAVAERRPVADLAVAYPDEVGEPVAADIGEVQALHGVGEEYGRALPPGPWERAAVRFPESALPAGGVPGKHVVAYDKHIGVTVAVEVDEPYAGVLEIHRRPVVEGSPRRPVAVVGAFAEPRVGAAELDEVEVAVAVQIEQLLPAAGKGKEVRVTVDEPLCAELSVAEVFLVEPRAGLLGEYPGHAFAVEVHPAVRGRQEPGRQVLSGDLVKGADAVVDPGLAVLEFERGQGLCDEAVPHIVAVPAMGDGGKHGQARRRAFAAKWWSTTRRRQSRYVRISKPER